MIVAISEAADAGSTAKLGMALRAAELENITIYTVGLSSAAAEWRTPLNGPTQAPEAPEGVMLGTPAPGTVQTSTNPTGASVGAGIGAGDLIGAGNLGGAERRESDKGTRSGSGHAGNGRRTCAYAPR